MTTVGSSFAPCCVCNTTTITMCPSCRHEVAAQLRREEALDGAVEVAAKSLRTVWRCVTCDLIRFENTNLPLVSGSCPQCGERGIDRSEV